MSHKAGRALRVDPLEALRAASADIRHSSLFSVADQGEGRRIAIQRAVAATLDGIPDEPLHALTLPVRRVLSPSEPAYLPDVCEALIRRAPELRAEIDRIRTAHCAGLQAPVLLASQRGLSAHGILKLWMNGVLFHNDAVKRHRFNALMAADFDGAVVAGVITGGVIHVAATVLELDSTVARLPCARTPTSLIRGDLTRPT